jgi:hypothetical protein
MRDGAPGNDLRYGDDFSIPTRAQLFHGAVAMSLAAEHTADPERRAALDAVAGWLERLYVAGDAR